MLIRKDKKGQMEIMGIAIVVVLMLVGLALVVAFVLLRPPSEFKEEFTQSQLASNTIGAILKTSVPECEEQMDDLIIDCATGPFIMCTNGTVESCEAVNKTLEIVFEETLNTFGTSFYFEVSDDSGNILNRSSEDVRAECRDKDTGVRLEREFASYVLPTGYNKDLNIVLMICKTLE